MALEVCRSGYCCERRRSGPSLGTGDKRVNSGRQDDHNLYHCNSCRSRTPGNHEAPSCNSGDAGSSDCAKLGPSCEDGSLPGGSRPGPTAWIVHAASGGTHGHI